MAYNYLYRSKRNSYRSNFISNWTIYKLENLFKKTKNSNGTCIELLGGYKIQSGYVPTPIYSTSGSFFTQNYPVEFLEKPVCTITLVYANGVEEGAVLDTTTTTEFKAHAFVNGGGTPSKRSASWIAVGY